MKLKPVAVLLVLSVDMFFAAGCAPVKLVPGKYVARIEEMKDLKPWVSLTADNQFVFNRGSVLSYRPSGTYSIDKDRLILTASPDEIYRFKIQKDAIVFESGALAERFVIKGTVFDLVRDE